MADSSTLYKLIILEMLERAASPLTGSQISEFILGKEYTNYFTLQKTLSELKEADFIQLTSRPGISLYRITEAGDATLEQLGYKISKAIRQDIRAYLKEKEMDIRDTLSVSADYFPGNNGEYLVRCRAREQDCTLMDLTLLVPSEQEAESAAANWNEKSQRIYAYLMKELL